MQWFAFIAIFLMAASSATFSARAAGGVQCVKTQCEGKGKSCIEALYVTYDACMKSGNMKCNTVPPAEKFSCLKGELTPCALARGSETDACLKEFKSCYRTCGPLDGGPPYYWCVGYLDADKNGVAAFCAADPHSSKPMDQCAKAIAPYPVSMECDPL